MSEVKRKPAAAGLQGDPQAFAVLTEIGIIAQLAENAFARLLPEDMTVAQFTVLNHLMRLDEARTIGDMARAMQVSQPTMSSTVRKLEDKGLVELVPDLEDRRIRRVAVTKAGRTMRARCVAALAKLDPVLADYPRAKWAKLEPLLNELRVILDEAR